MVFNKLFAKKNELKLTKDEIAELLRTTPEALEEFEAAYQKATLDFHETSLNPMDTSVQDIKTTHAGSENEIAEKIVNDLLSGKEPTILPADVKELPTECRPQLTAGFYTVQCDPHPSAMILMTYKMMLDAKTEQGKQHAYHMFRQGLDILDLDPLIYEMLGRNVNSMGYWFPKLKESVDSQEFFKVPKTKILKVPMEILQLSRLDYELLTPITLKIVDDYCMKAFDLDVSKTYFVKTGTYSSKFNFHNAMVTGEKEVRELGEYLLFLSNQAVIMAGPLVKPCIYGMSTTNEWVVREYIEDVENNPCIYNGMPLHTEYRVFADFDTDEILGVSPYWRPDVMLKRFGENSDPNSPHDKHDYVIYKMHEPVLMDRYEKNVEKVLENMQQIVRDTDLMGQWSIDVMQNGNDFYIIDMATACTSALSDCVPAGKIKKQEENWLPELK